MNALNELCRVAYSSEKLLLEFSKSGVGCANLCTRLQTWNKGLCHCEMIDRLYEHSVLQYNFKPYSVSSCKTKCAECFASVDSSVTADMLSDFLTSSFILHLHYVVHIYFFLKRPVVGITIPFTTCVFRKTHILGLSGFLRGILIKGFVKL